MYGSVRMTTMRVTSSEKQFMILHLSSSIFFAIVRTVERYFHYADGINCNDHMTTGKHSDNFRTIRETS